ncbi:MAG: T9SS type A sorting domain-containing protein [Ignavibacteriaceae bacterium]|nr:T9SS type A sorting domain-containing protein [Ignavibacteriaceae bacterium]
MIKLAPVFMVILLSFTLNAQHSNSALQTTPKSDVFLQGFYWNSPPGGTWYDSLRAMVPRLASAGFSAVWFPSPAKGAGGGMSMGYDPYDHFDFGEFNQKGSRETRFGSKQELVNTIRTFHEAGIQVWADAVLRHMMGGELETNYECRPVYNGNYIVSDSAYLIFQYPNGSGRFRKDASSFYPNSVNCWVDPLFVQTDPLFRFGEWLDHNKTSIRDSLIVWGQYLRNELGFDGFRLDAVKSVSPVFMAQWLNSSNPGGYAVAELWGSTSEIGNWLQIAKYQNNANVAMFDFPLRYTLKEMCNNTSGSFNMNNLDGAGLVNTGFSGFDVSTFVENHDFDRIGWDGQIDNGHDPILTDKQLAYAYILFSEGRPSVFFKDYVDYGYGGKIDTLIWIRQNYLAGGTTKRNGLNPYYIRQDGNQNQGSLSNDIYVAKRNGFENKPASYVIINDHPTQWIDVWVDTDLPVGAWYKDFTGNDVNKQVQPPIGSGPNRLKLWAKPRSYSIYVPDTLTSLNNPPVLSSIPDLTGYTNSLLSYKVNAFDANDTSLTFNLSGAPGWLSVSQSGVLSGTPSFSDTGSTVVILSVIDSQNASAVDTFVVSVFYNLPPVLASINDTTIKATIRYEYSTIASDPNSDTLNFFFNSAPNWLNIDRFSGVISGTPSVQDTGIYQVSVVVNDGKGASAQSNYNLTVRENSDTLIATYGKPVIDGIINEGTEWIEDWKIVVDPDDDSFWRPVDSINNELLAIFSTWDADSLYIAVDYILNDTYNTMMLYLDAGIPGGVTNFNSNQGYNGDYAKNFRFRSSDAIDFFMAAYHLSNPVFFKINGSTSDNITELTNGVRGPAARGVELAVAWNDLYSLGAGKVPPNVELKMVSLVAGGFNYGAGDAAPDNPDVNGDPGPDSLIFLASISPDTDGDGIPDPTIFISSTGEGIKSSNLPDDYALFQNYPNPFNPSTVIKFALPVSADVKIKIYDIMGAEVKQVIDGVYNPGVHSVSVDMSSFASGFYVYRIVTQGFSESKKMLLLK